MVDSGSNRAALRNVWNGRDKYRYNKGVQGLREQIPLIYLYMMSAGRFCHQRPERSFFFRGYQFPVCARCTGVFVGEIVAIASLIFKHSLSFIPCAVFVTIMGIDWSLQHFFKILSTNPRRFVTGILGGYGWTVIFISAIKHLIKFLLL